MKKIFKIILFLSFTIVFNVYADDAENQDYGLDKTSQQQVENAKAATTAYCKEDQQLDGCIYDANDPMYNKLDYSYTYRKVTPQHRADVGLPLKLEGLELSRGYQAFNGKGEGVYVGCYKVNYNPAEDKETNPFDKGTTLYIFTLIYKVKKQNTYACRLNHTYLVPAKGSRNRMKSAEVYFDGKTTPNMAGNNMEWATFNEWEALQNGECPNFFGYTSNTEITTNSKNKYIFSKNSSDFKLDAISFWRNDQYMARPGCMVSDDPGEAKNQELLNGILNEINNTECPSSIDGMKEYNEKFESYYERIRNDNEYRNLWSKGLSSQVTGDVVKNQIINAIRDKMTACNYAICNVTSSEISTINKNKGDECKDGCSINAATVPSTSSSASCYCCGGSAQGCVYKWIEKNPGNCAAVNNIKNKSQCIGTSKDAECRSCLLKAYEAANLSEEKKQCLAKNEVTMELTLQNIALENEKAANADVEKEQEENEELREEMFNGQFNPIELFINDQPMTCEQILGKVLTKIVRTGITIIQIICAILAIVKGMMILIPAVIAKDADALKKASKTLAMMGIILALVIIFRPLITLIGHILEYDVSCII